MCYDSWATTTFWKFLYPNGLGGADYGKRLKREKRFGIMGVAGIKNDLAHRQASFVLVYGNLHRYKRSADKNALKPKAQNSSNYFALKIRYIIYTCVFIHICIMVESRRLKQIGRDYYVVVVGPIVFFKCTDITRGKNKINF